MGAIFIAEAQTGEWFEVGAKITNEATHEPVDVTGRLVGFAVRDGPAHTDPAVTVDGSMARVVNGPGGEIAVGGRIAQVGDFWATVSVGEAADGPGWPVKALLMVRITDAP